jgi:predicted SpoU family rRNA methylase
MALRFNLVIDQGSDFEVTFPVLKDGQPQDLAGWSARSQVRHLVTDAVVLHDFADELSLVESDVQLAVPAEVSTAWAWRLAVYDIEIVDPTGDVTRLVEGQVIVRPEVTR